MSFEKSLKPCTEVCGAAELKLWKFSSWLSRNQAAASTSNPDYAKPVLFILQAQLHGMNMSLHDSLESSCWSLGVGVTFVPMGHLELVSEV